jgi:hypothetical protein
MGRLLQPAKTAGFAMTLEVIIRLNRNCSVGRSWKVIYNSDFVIMGIYPKE